MTRKRSPNIQTMRQASLPVPPLSERRASAWIASANTNTNVHASITQESTLRKLPGRPPVTSLVDYQGFCGFSVEAAAPPSDDDEQEQEEQEEGFQRISPQEVVERMEGGWAPFVLDVRWAEMNLEFARKSLFSGCCFLKWVGLGGGRGGIPLAVIVLA